jgi:hypothetical protein
LGAERRTLNRRYSVFFEERDPLLFWKCICGALLQVRP